MDLTFPFRSGPIIMTVCVRSYHKLHAFVQLQIPKIQRQTEAVIEGEEGADRLLTLTQELLLLGEELRHPGGVAVAVDYLLIDYNLPVVVGVQVHPAGGSPS